MSAIDDIATERKRQIEGEGWSMAHDDRHQFGQMAYAAACYALVDRAALKTWFEYNFSTIWPWESRWWKPKDRRRNLVRAGALIVAEIERLDRATETSR
jgi:hypothetical protein